MNYETRHRKLKIEQYEPPKNGRTHVILKAWKPWWRPIYVNKYTHK